MMLSVYNTIVTGNRVPGYILCKHIPVSFSKSDSIDKLWLKHDEALKNFRVCHEKPSLSLLDLKREIRSSFIS